MSNRKVLIDALKKLGSAKAPTQQKDMIIDPRGQWAHPGKNTRIPSNNITMDNVPYPVYADPNVGPSRMMYPEQEYNFPGADYVDEYPQMRSGGNKQNHVVVKPSKIEGADKGLFSNQGFRKDQLIGLAHKNGQPVGHIGKMHNHSDEPNMYSIKKGNQRYVYAKRDIQPGEELTTDYRQQPELEQPEDFMRKGGSAPRLPKKKNSRGYSRSLEATNKFFAQHAFFAKPKSRKNKIYDPNAKYYQDGGIPYSNLPATYQSALQNFVYPNVIDDPERTGYNSVNNTISYDSQSPVENMDTQWWMEHELFHDLQNQAGGMSTSGVVGQRPNPYVASDDAMQGYYNRREADVNRTVDGMIAENPNLQFIPRDKLIEGSQPGFVGAEDLQYADPSTVEGEARQYEQYIREGNPSIFPNRQNGGDLPSDVSLSYLPEGERSYYDPILDTIYLDPNASEEELNHEMAHAWQNRNDLFRSDPYSPKLRPSAAASDEQAATYFNRIGDDVDRYTNNLKTIVPELGGHTWNADLDRFIPDQIKYDKEIDPLMYRDPSTVEGEAEYMSQVYGRPALGIKQYGGDLPEDYSQFQSFAQTLPSNLQDPNFEYGNPDQYNLYGMWETVGKPGSFADVQDGEYFPLQDDGRYHGFTVGSDGEFLKPMSHGTTWKEVMNAHLNTDPYFQQNRIIKNDQGRLQYVPREEEEYIETELTPEEIEQYAKGGYVIEDISIPSLTKAQGGGPTTGIVKGGNTLSKIISGEGNVTNLLRLTNRAITPVGYGFAGKLMAAPLTFIAPYKPKTYNLQNRYDAWDIYNQMAPRYGGISANADGTAAIKDFEIAKDVLDKIRKSKKTAFETVDFNDDLLAGNSVNFGGVHGNGHATKGVDEDGRDYIDFTDIWDLQPFQRRGFLPQAVRNFEAGTLTGGKPFELRNRIYFDKDGQYFDHDGNPLTEYEREMPNMKYSAAAKKVQSNAASGDIKDVETKWKMQKFLTTKNISQDEFNSTEDDWGSADNRAKLYQYGTLLGGVGLGAYESYQHEQSTKPRLMFNTETSQYDLVTPAQIKTFPGRYVDTRPEQQYGGTLPKKQLGGLTKYAEFLPGITRFTPGNALRAAVYRGVNPASYNIKEKATGFPKEIFNTTFNNETRPFRVGMSLKYGTPEFLNTFLATKRITPQEYAKMPDSEKMMLHNEDTREILQDIGRRRLDAWAVGLKQPQEYNTLDQVGDNTYRMKDISYTPDFFSERYADIQAQGVKDRGYSYGEENPLVTIAKQHYDRTPHPFIQLGNADNFIEQELFEKYQNAPRSYIDKVLGFPQYEPEPWTQMRHAGMSTINQDPSFKYSVWDNDSYGVMGGYRWDVAKNPEGMHWQANDVWDINPFERRGSAYINQNDVFKKLLHANYFKPLQNVEVLGALGGKPFNIQNNFLIDPVTFKPLKQWQKGGFLKRRKKQPEQMEPIEVLQPGQEAFPLPETPVRDQWYEPIVLKDMTQEELDAYNKAYEEEQARLKFEADKAAQPSYFDEAKNWVSNWHDSPMYNQMVLNSYNGQQKNADYLTKLRKKNIADLPPLNVLDAEAEDNNSNLPDSSGVAAWSKSGTGQIEVFPGGYDYGPSLFTHEILHSSDRPRELYNYEHPAYNTGLPVKYFDDKNIDLGRSWKMDENDNVVDYPDWMLYNDPRFPEDGAIWHDRVMPKSDQMYITTHRSSNWKDNETYKLNKAAGWYTPRTDEKIKKDLIENGFDPNEPEFNNIFETIKKQDKKDAKDFTKSDKKYWKEFGHDYVSDPTEVRARLGEIRFHAQKEGIYDPFTEQITPEIFQNYINKDRDSKNWQPLKPIKELRHEFTDEEILYMLQHISKNDSEEGSEFDEQTAKFGGAYELGDEVDETTMKKLKKLGYTFEKI